MTSYIIRRLLQSVVVLLIVTFMLFFTMRLLPGDPILMYMTMRDVEGSTQAEVDALKKEFGLDKPMMVQYVKWVSDAVRGDLGKSILNRSSVGTELKRTDTDNLLFRFSFFNGEHYFKYTGRHNKCYEEGQLDGFCGNYTG